MTDDRQERIRQRAHEIWEREGRPHGAHERHWHQAANEIEAEVSKGKKPVRAAAAKPAKTATPATPKAAAKAAKAPAKTVVPAKAAATAKTPAKTVKPAAKIAEVKPTAKKAAKPKAPAKAV